MEGGDGGTEDEAEEEDSFMPWQWGASKIFSGGERHDEIFVLARSRWWSVWGLEGKKRGS